MKRRTTVGDSVLAAAVADMMGWCPNCQEFVNEGSVEPDAEGYTCEQCGTEGVVGAEDGLLRGLFDVTSDEP